MPASHADPRRLAADCLRALPSTASRDERRAFATCLDDLTSGELRPPKRGRGFDWKRVAQASGLREAELAHVRPQLTRVLRLMALRAPVPTARPRRSTPVVPSEPEVSGGHDPELFHRALDLHMRRNGDTVHRLHKELLTQGAKIASSTLAIWRRGGKVPCSEEALKVLALIERRYGLQPGYFESKRSRHPKAIYRRAIPGVLPPEMRRLAWHLPNDFNERPFAEQQEILAWVRDVIIRGTTEYRRYQAAALQNRYGLQFSGTGSRAARRTVRLGQCAEGSRCRRLNAPPELNREMTALVAFKKDVLTAPGFRRNGVWNQASADQRIEHLGLLFGAMAAPVDGPIDGLGVPHGDLSFAMLAMPSVWDWYVQWRERRRGFFTRWEVDLLSVGAALVRKETGWLRQRPDLAARLRPVDGLIPEDDVARAQADWAGQCDRTHIHNLARMKEIARVARVHRDPFEAVLPVLEADNPLAEYRKITEEIVSRMPDGRRYPKAAAEAVRSLLMLRLGLHTGLRQRNLRELMLCPPEGAPRSERWLADNRRGELRWSERDAGWEIYIPAVAFKNSSSSFFGNRPFRLILPDLADLNRYISDYVHRHRALLLNGAADPGTFFVKSAKATSRTATYDQTTFYEAWRLTIQRYGIYNPYTGRGAIRGLLPHGPHNVRDVLATHILKQTGSYEQASYAIQDTPEMVSKHYGRFLPQDKASLAAQVLNKVWS